MPRARKKTKYVIKAHVRMAPSWEVERVYVFLHPSYTLTGARESARRKLVKLDTFVGNIETYHFKTMPDDIREELYKQAVIRSKQGRFLWLRKKTNKLVLDRTHRVLRVVRTTA